MNCDEARERLVELDGEGSISVRDHLARCAACARELERHRRTWALLGSIEHDGVVVGRERLEQMADEALASASASAAPSSPWSPPSIVRALSSRWSRVAAAAGLLLAVSLGARMVWRGAHGGSSGRPPANPDPNPACLDDPEFVKNFDVIRDLPDLDADGELFDVDDDVLLLAALEGA